VNVNAHTCARRRRRRRRRRRIRRRSRRRRRRRRRRFDVGRVLVLNSPCLAGRRSGLVFFLIVHKVQRLEHQRVQVLHFLAVDARRAFNQGHHSTAVTP
jgi:hypothetical protein